jgi:hypothetical protein
MNRPTGLTPAQEYAADRAASLVGLRRKACAHDVAPPYKPGLALIRAAIATFPETFGLRAYPGDVFRLSERSSYVANDAATVPTLYTQCWRSRAAGWHCDEWCDFAKGTPDELRRQLVKASP